MLGRDVVTLINQKQSAGNHEVQFDASKLSSGMYFYRTDVGNTYQAVKKMLMIK